MTNDDRAESVRRIEACGIVAVIRIQDGSRLRSVVDALAAGGITALEVTMSVPRAIELIGESARLRFAALPIGDNFTMGVDDAVKAADFVRCNEILGLHYNTFPPIRIDTAEAVEKFKAAGKNLHLLLPGESHNF